MTSKPKSSTQAKFPFSIPIAYFILFLVLAVVLNVLLYLILSANQHKVPIYHVNSQTATYLALHTATPSQTPFHPGPTSTKTPTVTPTFPPTPTLEPTTTLEPTATDIPLPTDTPHPSGLPGSARLAGFIGHAQFYNLDCESRSAVDFARYLGNDLVETTFLNQLPQSDDPNKGFVGSYNDPVGQIPPDSYGVYADPIADLLTSLGTPAQGISSFTWNQVRKEIANGRPVIVWVIYGIESGTPIEYVVPSDGSTVIVAHYEHTVIVIGYTSDTVTVMDGASRYSVSLSQFLDSWSVFGYLAVIAQ
jgi:uncharacterized protein YvpB